MTKNLDVRMALESRIEDLYHEADDIVSHYWDTVIKMEKRRKGVENKNRLRLRCVKQSNSIRVEWQGIVWVGKGKDGKLFDKREHITKPARSFTYTLSKLYKFAHEWEKEIVDETESRLSGIRREAHHLTRALISVGHAEAVEEKRNAEDVVRR